jgi:hypothetical protein
MFMDQLAAINQATVQERLFLLFDVTNFLKFVVNCIVITLWVFISNLCFLTHNDLPFSLSA